jgi:hypothetical protein
LGKLLLFALYWGLQAFFVKAAEDVLENSNNDVISYHKGKSDANISSITG